MGLLLRRGRWIRPALGPETEGADAQVATPESARTHCHHNGAANADPARHQTPSVIGSEQPLTPPPTLAALARGGNEDRTHLSPRPEGEEMGTVL
jgi:hypothetical protein